jgi:protein-S-isoprenylcysteine O-methyltransferase Ste14
VNGSHRDSRYHDVAFLFLVGEVSNAAVMYRLGRLRGDEHGSLLRRVLRSSADVVWLPKAPSEDRGTRHLLVLGSFAGIGSAIVAARRLPEFEIPADCRALRGIARVVGLLGVGLRVYGMWTLGASASQFVDPKSNVALVTRGPYAVIRHPAYAGAFLQFTATGLLLRNWCSAACGALVPAVARVPRLLHEEATLRETFGETYDAYAERTPRFVPRLRRLRR